MLETKACKFLLNANVTTFFAVIAQAAHFALQINFF